MTSRGGYHIYAERVVPLLSRAQKKCDFSKRFWGNWGLGKGNYLLVMYDKKMVLGFSLAKGGKKVRRAWDLSRNLPGLP